MNSRGKLFIDCPAPEKKDAFSVEKELSETEYVKMLRDYSTTIGTGMPRNNSLKQIVFYKCRISLLCLKVWIAIIRDKR